MLEIKGLRSGYGRTSVVGGVSLKIETGESVGILGRNGVGKSTLLKTLVGILPVGTGSIIMDGTLDLTSAPAHERARSGIGYVPQGRQIFPRLSVLDNIRVAAVACGRNADERVERMLEEFPALRSKLKALGGSLSGGQQQILALARALATEPTLLLLDEPTEGIQPSIVDDILDKLLDLRKRLDLSILLVEQNMDFMSNACERVYIMDKGLIVAETTGEQVATDRYIQQQYLGV